MDLEHLPYQAIVDILNTLETGVVITNMEKNVLWFNQTVGQIFNLPPLSDENNGIDTHSIKTIFEANTHIEIICKKRTLTFTRKQVSIRNSANEELLVHYLYDISSNVKLTNDLTLLRDQLMAAQFRDPITGLLSERAFYLILEPQIARCRRYRNPLTVIAMKFSFTEEANNIDRHTEHVRLASQQLKEVMRWADQLHYEKQGNFLIVLPETCATEVESLINKIDTKLINYPWLEGISFGVTQWLETDSLESLIKRAKLALNSSKLQNNKLLIL